MTKRAALYVYDTAKVSIAPQGTIELHQMADDYSARAVAKVGRETTLDLKPGVYGFWYEDEHGLKADRNVTVVLDTALERKQPWPAPPPPPPQGFTARRDWDEHRSIFLVSLGSDILMSQ